jgi:hypothetical protein
MQHSLQASAKTSPTDSPIKVPGVFLRLESEAWPGPKAAVVVSAVQDPLEGAEQEAANASP